MPFLPARILILLAAMMAAIVMGATNPAEFFAVATETFFRRPHELREQSAAMYATLRKYYGLDPAALVPAADAASSDR